MQIDGFGVRHISGKASFLFLVFAFPFAANGFASSDVTIVTPYGTFSSPGSYDVTLPSNAPATIPIEVDFTAGCHVVTSAPFVGPYSYSCDDSTPFPYGQKCALTFDMYLFSTVPAAAISATDQSAGTQANDGITYYCGGESAGVAFYNGTQPPPNPSPCPNPYPTGSCPIGCFQLSLTDFGTTDGGVTFIYPKPESAVAEILGDAFSLPTPGAQFDFTAAAAGDSFIVSSPTSKLNLPCAIQDETLSVYAEPTGSGSNGVQISCTGSSEGSPGSPVDAFSPQVFQSTSTAYSNDADVTCDYGTAPPWSSSAAITAITTTMEAAPDSTNTSQPVLIRQQLQSSSPQGDQKIQHYLNDLDPAYPVGAYGCALASLSMVTAQDDPYYQNDLQLGPINEHISFKSPPTGFNDGFLALTSPNLDWWSATPLMTGKVYSIQLPSVELSQGKMVFDDSYFGHSSPADLAAYLEKDGVPVIVKVHSLSRKYNGKPIDSRASTGGHFVVVWGISNGEFQINDPAFGRKFLSGFQEFSDGPWFVIRGKAVPGVSLARAMAGGSGSYVFGASGGNLSIKDTNGNETGIDPSSGTYVNKIPGAFFGQDGIAAADGSADMPAAQYVEVPTSSASYHVTLSNVSSGASSLKILQLAPNKTIQSSQTISLSNLNGSSFSLDLSSDGTVIPPAPSSKGIVEIEPGGAAFSFGSQVWGLVWIKILPTNPAVELSMSATLDGQPLALIHESDKLSQFEASSLLPGLHKIEVKAALAGDQVDDAVAYLVVKPEGSK